MSGQIDRYLDELFVALRDAAPHEARSLLSETEAHLRDAADDAGSRGLDQHDAEAWAIARFGSAAMIADADRRRVAPLWRSVAVSAWTLGAIGAIAVGVSGVIAGVMHVIGAPDRFIAPGSTDRLSSADCARWTHLSPGATSCAQAALRDWTAETISYRVALGLLGVVALAVYAAGRRWSSRVRRLRPLPSMVTDTIGVMVFLVAAIVVAALAVDGGSNGLGGWFSAGAVAVAMTGAFGLRLRREVAGGGLPSSR